MRNEISQRMARQIKINKQMMRRSRVMSLFILICQAMSCDISFLKNQFFRNFISKLIVYDGIFINIIVARFYLLPVSPDSKIVLFLYNLIFQLFQHFYCFYSQRIRRIRHTVESRKHLDLYYTSNLNITRGKLQKTYYAI